MYNHPSTSNPSTLNNSFGRLEETVPQRETEIGSVLRKLTLVIEQSESMTEQLGIRLCNVMNGGGVKNAGENARTPEYSTPLAQEINRAVYRIEKINADLMEMKNRIEL